MTEQWMTIEQLTSKEEELIALFNSVAGTINQKSDRNIESEVNAAFRDIHLEYSCLLGDPQSGLEALKRALFIQWIAQAEPPRLTGIQDLYESAEKRVLKFLDTLFREGKPDSELIMMIAWYNQVTDWYFQEMKELSGIRCFVESEHGKSMPNFRKSQFENRGMMGEYWQSLRFASGMPHHNSE
jgi:hypothetical protein